MESRELVGKQAALQRNQDKQMPDSEVDKKGRIKCSERYTATARPVP